MTRARWIIALSLCAVALIVLPLVLDDVRDEIQTHLTRNVDVTEFTDRPVTVTATIPVTMRPGQSEVIGLLAFYRTSGRFQPVVPLHNCEIQAPDFAHFSVPGSAAERIISTDISGRRYHFGPDCAFVVTPKHEGHLPILYTYVLPHSEKSAMLLSINVAQRRLTLANLSTVIAVVTASLALFLKVRTGV